MSVTPSSVSVLTTATLIATNATALGPDSGNIKVLVRNVTATATIFLGGDSSITASNAGGWPWLSTDSPIECELEPGESLYGIVATTPQTVNGLKQGR